MALDRALRAFNLQPTDRIPSQEWLDHPEFIRKITGIDPFERPTEAVLAAIRALDIDWVGDLPRAAVKFEKDERTKKGADGNTYTEWGFTGSIWEDEHVFADVDQVLAYSPLEDARGAGRVRVVSREYRTQRIAGPREARGIAGDACLITGLYYTTLFQFGIMAFGWEHFLTAAASEPDRFREILAEFAQISEENVREWVRDDCPVLWFHDDVAMTSGLVFPPDWYRREIFPHYDRILQPARDAGKKLIFVSDGNYMDLMDDLLALGIDGLMVDPTNDLETVLRKCGPNRAVIGNINTLTLTTGSTDDVRREVRRCAELGKRYPGYFFKAAGDLPHNIPLDNMQAYFDAKAELGVR